MQLLINQLESLVAQYGAARVRQELDAIELAEQIQGLDALAYNTWERDGATLLGGES